MPQITIQFRETRTTKPSHNPQISEPPSNIWVYLFSISFIAIWKAKSKMKSHSEIGLKFHSIERLLITIILILHKMSLRLGSNFPAYRGFHGTLNSLCSICFQNWGDMRSLTGPWWHNWSIHISISGTQHGIPIRR
jgi:hypothetical protein